MKSDSSTSSAESEDSDSDSKEQEDIAVSGRVTTTSTPTKSTPADSGKKVIIQTTLEESIQKQSPTLTSFVQDFRANRLALQDTGKVSRKLVEHFSSRYAESRKLKNLYYFSLKTSEDSSATIKDLRSKSSSNRWRIWGIFQNGNALTADISAFPKIGREFSLSDILETEVDEKYFLSDKQMNWLRQKAMEDPKFSMKLARQSTADTEQDGEHTPKNS